MARLSELAGSVTAVRKSTANRAIFDGNDGVHPNLLAWWLAFQSKAASMDIPLRVVWGVRTKQQQNKLFKAKRSRARFPFSAHNHGLALDIIHTQHAWNKSMTTPMWGMLGALGKEVARSRGLKVDWGGDWEADWAAVPPQRGWDPAHWQVSNWRSLTDLPR